MTTTGKNAHLYSALPVFEVCKPRLGFTRCLSPEPVPAPILWLLQGVLQGELHVKQAAWAWPSQCMQMPRTQRVSHLE